jgi:putative ABC transport system substrate-binding protein
MCWSVRIIDPVKSVEIHETTGTGMKVTLLAFALSALLFAHCQLDAQQHAKIPRLGIVINNSDPSQSMDAFRHTLKELGYFDGKNINLEYRYTEGDRDRVPVIVSELVRLKVDILFSTQAIVIRAAKQATKTIPIIMAITPDPVAAGLVDTLSRPGGNITGLTLLTRDLSGKRLELLTEIIPRLARVGIINIVGFPAIKDYVGAAHHLKIQVQPLEVRLPNPDLRTVFQLAVKERAGAIIVVSVPGLSAHRKEVIDLALRNRLPLMAESATVTDGGALISYDANRNEVFKRAAIYVDKLLKGANPARLPVETPTKFELVINLKTAKQIGLTIPPNVLARADRVIR